MSALPTPRLADLDDPLAPRREPTAATPGRVTPPAARTDAEAQRLVATAAPPEVRSPSEPSDALAAPSSPPSLAAAPSLAHEQLVAVFARIPESLSDRLADGVRALNAGRPRRGRVSQQDVVGALVERYVTPDAPAELGDLVDAFRRRTRR